MPIAAPLHLLDQTCTIERDDNLAATTRDAGGSSTADWQTHLTAVMCRVQPGSGSEIIQGGRIVGMLTHTVYVEGGQDITHSDRIVLSGGDILDIRGITDFDVQGMLVRLDCEKDYGDQS